MVALADGDYVLHKECMNQLNASFGQNQCMTPHIEGFLVEIL